MTAQLRPNFIFADIFTTATPRQFSLKAFPCLSNLTRIDRAFKAFNFAFKPEIGIKNILNRPTATIKF